VYDARDMDPVRPDVRPRTSVLGAWWDGWRRVGRAPVLILGLVLIQAWVLEWQWRLSGGYAWGPGAAIGLHLSWVFWQEPFAFGGGARLLVQALSMPAVPLLTFWSLIGSLNGLAPAVGWLAVSGGALDRLARARPVGAVGFFTATGVLLFRLVRLAVLLGGLTWLAVWGVSLLEARSVEVPDPSSAVRLTVELGCFALLAILGDVAQVRMAVEDRRSVFSALGASWRFVSRRLGRLVALYALNMVLAVAAIGLLRQVATALIRTEPDAMIVVAWAMLVVDVLIRLGFMATVTAFFQGELAHAGYTARPVPTWPDSPAVEAITDLEARSRSATSGRPLPL
jgi:hypothetical protein